MRSRTTEQRAKATASRLLACLNSPKSATNCLFSSESSSTTTPSSQPINSPSYANRNSRVSPSRSAISDIFDRKRLTVATRCFSSTLSCRSCLLAARSAAMPVASLSTVYSLSSTPSLLQSMAIFWSSSCSSSLCFPRSSSRRARSTCKLASCSKIDCFPKSSGIGSPTSTASALTSSRAFESCSRCSLSHVFSPSRIGSTFARTVDARSRASSAVNSGAFHRVASSEIRLSNSTFTVVRAFAYAPPTSFQCRTMRAGAEGSA